jgi:hypothetical protein
MPLADWLITRMASLLAPSSLGLYKTSQGIFSHTDQANEVNERVIIMALLDRNLF